MRRLPTTVLAGAIAAPLVACAPPSDTPAGFEAKTRIALCPSAKVEHINRDHPTRIVGREEIYSTRITMTDECARDFYKRLSSLSERQCSFQGSCFVRTEYGLTITVQKIELPMDEGATGYLVTASG